MGIQDLFESIDTISCGKNYAKTTKGDLIKLLSTIFYTIESFSPDSDLTAKACHSLESFARNIYPGPGY